METPQRKLNDYMTTVTDGFVLAPRVERQDIRYRKVFKEFLARRNQGDKNYSALAVQSLVDLRTGKKLSRTQKKCGTLQEHSPP